ncbi:regulatory protein YycH of two-component signal transduction system YycFG [Paenibacillus taihuensis]|uniref:Regulatory protein YycH of two-component signal transduction system YycFG n=1 Tax=Paenibacillus taihuensis TaxID=1156355 RepID=A0A3D9RI25_9BACL|nr:two-component system activity regulator YycH [Paenibacillus taihuensis]REE78616.1 regulatory protein YycH of two-component signal transduction system YycFG [Paenibacillus taihuensis]
MDKLKTIVLTALVIMSLVQSYLLAYSMPGLGVTASPLQPYVQPEPMGQEEKVENVIFPEDMVLHLGKGKHTVLYPATNFYNLIFGKIKSREFKGFQRSPAVVVDWEDIRDRDQGLELRFGRGVPVELLSKVLKLEGDVDFMNDVINRIWIYKSSDRDEVRTYFFSTDNITVYESVKADLTAQDVQMYVGYGEYQVSYRKVGDDMYIPDGPIESMQSTVGYDSYSPEQMQRYLFVDPGVTREISDRSGTQIYTDGKRGLQVEQNGRWISYTDPVALQGQEDNESQNVYAAIQFINQHGGWDGMHRFVHAGSFEQSVQVLRFQQYYGSYPIIPQDPFLFGSMKLRLLQGVVSEYERSLLTLQKKPQKRDIRWLPGGDMVENALEHYSRRLEVTALYPALLASPADKNKMLLAPVWAVRLLDGSQAVLLKAIPGGYKPQPGEPGGAPLVKDTPTTGSGGGIGLTDGRLNLPGGGSGDAGSAANESGGATADHNDEGTSTASK